ncbi:MAG: Gfo/Idh/MocA family oxidoreductase [Isosphaeraceae bacterium]
MAGKPLRMGIVGCGRAARIHLDRLRTRDDVQIVGCADLNLEAARTLGRQVSADEPPPAFADHKELLAKAAPDALAIFTPHLAHYRPAMDALQAGCHVFIEKPLSTNAQEAQDIVGLAKGRNLRVGVGHQYRLLPSLVEARRQVSDGVIGPLRLVTAVLAAPWLALHQTPGDSWRLDPKIAGGGLLADAGEHLIDALLWTTGQSAQETAAFQDQQGSGLDLVTAATVRLDYGTLATLGLSGVAPASWFEISYFGTSGCIRATDQALWLEQGGSARSAVALPAPTETIDGNFVTAVLGGTPPCCPADQAVDTVRLLEAISRSAATGQVVRLV